MASLVMLAPLAAHAHVGPHVPSTASASASANLQWVKQVPIGTLGAEDAPSVFAEGSTRVGRYLYVTENTQGLVIFDLRDPLDPVRVGSYSIDTEGLGVGAHAQENERVATNGQIVLLSQLGDAQYGGSDAGRASQLHIIDVRDKRSPRLIKTVSGAGDHTWTCLLDCGWAYSTHGLILDLRNPAAPRVSERNWIGEVFAQYGSPAGFPPNHHVVEVAPGQILASTNPMMFIDAAKPEAPVLLATSVGDVPPGHNVDWPRGGADDFIIGASEPINGGFARCEQRDALGYDTSVSTWGARQWQKTKSFRLIDRYHVRHGEHDPVVGVGIAPNSGCGAHFFGIHPEFHNGGLVAEASYSHGLKLLEVSSTGHMREVGHFLAPGANTGDAIWVTSNVLYVFDFQRGIDIVRLVRQR